MTEECNTKPNINEWNSGEVSRIPIAKRRNNNSRVIIPYCGLLEIGSSRDRENASIVTDFVNECAHAFERDTPWGHITASAFILNSSRDHVLLTHHVKLERWLPLGGHCDGIRDPRFVAFKEAYEESGLTHLRSISDLVFDIDIHDIPANGNMPRHKHLDIRYVFEADQLEELRPTQESKALAWVQLDRLEDYANSHPC